MELTKTDFRGGVWRGLLTGAGETRPEIEVTYEGAAVADVTLAAGPTNGSWQVCVPVPPDAVGDGVRILAIHDPASGTLLGNITVIGDDAADDDLRAEVGLLRAELDLLKTAFRRHCASQD